MTGYGTSKYMYLRLHDKTIHAISNPHDSLFLKHQRKIGHSYTLVTTLNQIGWVTFGPTSIKITYGFYDV